MGGRGGSSRMGSAGGYSGMDVTKDGETTRYYFTSKNGINYYQRGIGGTPEPTPLNMSASEMRRRVQANGASVRSVSPSERAAERKAYKVDKEATKRFLHHHDVSNKTMSRGSRTERTANRVNRRRRS